MAEELSPCPFCGGRAQLDSNEKEVDRNRSPRNQVRWWITCMGCALLMFPAAKREDAVGLWERRVLRKSEATHPTQLNLNESER